MVGSLGSAALRWSGSLLLESHLEEIVDPPAPVSWSKNHTAEVGPVEVLYEAISQNSARSNSAFNILRRLSRNMPYGSILSSGVSSIESSSMTESLSSLSWSELNFSACAIAGQLCGQIDDQKMGPLTSAFKKSMYA